MTRLRQRRAIREYLPGHRESLLHGHTFRAAPGFDNIDDDIFAPIDAACPAVKQAWVDLRAELLPEHVRGCPGTRPWGWWQFDAPERLRRVLGGTLLPIRDDQVAFGRTKVFSGANINDQPVWESQPAFLARHGLLTDTERAAMGDCYATEET